MLVLTMCVYIYIYVCICIHIHIYIYIALVWRSFLYRAAMHGEDLLRSRPILTGSLLFADGPQIFLLLPHLLIVRTFLHISPHFPLNFVIGNCCTPATTPFVLIPSGSCQNPRPWPHRHQIETVVGRTFMCTREGMDNS